MSASRPLVPFRTLSKELVADCRVFRVEKVLRQSGLTGEIHDYFHIDASTWVHVVPVTTSGDIVLVRQERHGAETFTLELPGGVVEAGEDPGAAALRELREETGYTGAAAEPLGWVHPNPALQANRCFAYLARDVTLAGAQDLDPREEIEVVTMPYLELRERVRRGEITHSLVVSALFLYELHGR